MKIEHKAMDYVETSIRFLGATHTQDRGLTYTDGCRYTLDVDCYVNGTRCYSMLEIHGDSEELLQAIADKIVKDFS
tara:strand:+ start:260 stop:487 length:228 start_codon:yes stop_codon:yes gene_type:complete